MWPDYYWREGIIGVARLQYELRLERREGGWSGSFLQRVFC